MEMIVAYLIFALTTSVVCLTSIYIPVVNNLLALENPPDLVQGSSKYMLLMVLFVSTLLFAPVMIFIYLSHDKSERFRAHLFKDFMED